MQLLPGHDLADVSPVPGVAAPHASIAHTGCSATPRDLHRHLLKMDNPPLEAGELPF